MFLKTSLQHEGYKHKVTEACSFAREVSLQFQVVALMLLWPRCLTE